MEHDWNTYVYFWLSKRDFETISQAIADPKISQEKYTDWLKGTEAEVKEKILAAVEYYIIYVNPDHFFDWASENEKKITWKSVSDFAGDLHALITGGDWDPSRVR